MKLESLPGWEWDPLDAEWKRKLERLLDFAAEHGQVRGAGEALGLSSWITDNRQEYKDGRLDSARQYALEAIPGWLWDPQGDQWERAFAGLVKYVEENGTAQIPLEAVSGNFQVGRFVAGQRSAYRQNGLDAARRTRLEALPGWTWTPDETAWQNGYEKLTQYSHREGHAQPPIKHREDGYPLGAWVVNQRRSFATRKLSSARRGQLENLPGWVWNTREANWDRNYRLLAQFARREGTAEVSKKHREGGIALGLWADRQVEMHDRGRLSVDRVRRLEELPGWVWHPHEAQWEAGYEALCRFVKREGHARVPLTHIESGFELGKWVVRQRRAKRTGRLGKGRSGRLERNPGWVWNPKQGKWQDGFTMLRAWIDHHGDARVPDAARQGEFSLGNWVNRQRLAHRRNELPADRIRLLEALPGWTWEPRKAGAAS